MQKKGLEIEAWLISFMNIIGLCYKLNLIFCGHILLQPLISALYLKDLAEPCFIHSKTIC